MLPKALPLRLAIPTQVAGDLLQLDSKSERTNEEDYPGKRCAVRSLYLDEMAAVVSSPFDVVNASLPCETLPCRGSRHVQHSV